MEAVRHIKLSSVLFFQFTNPAYSDFTSKPATINCFVDAVVTCQLAVRMMSKESSCPIKGLSFSLTFTLRHMPGRDSSIYSFTHPHKLRKLR